MSIQQPINMSLIDVEDLVPETVVTNEFFGEALQQTKNRMFLGTKERRHFHRGDLASVMLAEATKKLMERLNLNPATDIDMILTNVSVPDQPFTGCGAVVNKLIGGKAKWILDMHNTGCVSFIYMLEAARAYMLCHGVKTAIIGNVQSAAGRIFAQEDNRVLPQAAIPGDGCAVAYVTMSDERPILVTVQDNFPDYSEDMFANMDGKNWWEAREVTGSIDFSEDKSARIMIRGNKLVPQMIHLACEKIGIKSKQLDFLITNQPNKFFLRNWREAVLLPEEKHLHTFDQYANLFGAGIPITLAQALKQKQIKKGDLICMAGFSHAGDYAAASIVRW